jgi:molecular chaperone IbpA
MFFLGPRLIDSFGLEHDKTSAETGKSAYPPYNLIKIDEDNLCMEFAIAGFKKDEVDISVDKRVLTVKADKLTDKDERDYLHKGIAARRFARSFTLPEYFEVDGARLSDGILFIDLVRNVPEEKKPKQIPIK